MEKAQKLCVFQMHHTDITEALAANNAIDAIRDSGVFDAMVIACADVPENQKLRTWAQKWDLPIRFGDVDNVVLRMQEIIREFDASYVARFLTQWYFVDVYLIERMLGELEKLEGDYIRLPRDFDFRFGGDVFSSRMMDYLHAKFSEPMENERYFKFNPWSYVDLFGDVSSLKVVDFEEVPVYSREDFREFRERYNRVWPHHWDKGGAPQAAYGRAVDFIVPNETRILDIACGFGSGSKFLTQFSPKHVLGADISEKSIQRSRQLYGDQENLEFKVVDAL